MLESIYCPLPEAAQKLGLSLEMLVHQGRLGQIRIVIPKPPQPVFCVESVDYDTRKHFTEYKTEAWIGLMYFTRYHLEGKINYGSHHPEGPALPVHPVSLGEYECGFLEQDVVLYLHRLDDGRIGEMVKLLNPCTGKPLKIGRAHV